MALVKSENRLAVLIDFGNFLDGFPKSQGLIVLNIDWVQFVLKTREILHSVRGLYDIYYWFTSDVMYKKY